MSDAGCLGMGSRFGTDDHGTFMRFL